MSPLHYDNEDKIQEEYYKDVRKPSTLQSRPSSVASSLRDEPARAPHCACAPRDPSAHTSQLQLENGQKAVVCQLGEQHHPATSVDKKLVAGRRPVSDLPAPGDPHTSDSIVTSPPRDPPRP